MLQTLAFPAGGRMINAKADSIRIESVNAGGADESVRVRADGQDLGLFLPGDDVTLPVSAALWEVTPVTVGASGTVRLGMGRVKSSRITGIVKVVDQGADKTQQGVQFVGSIFQSANVAAVSVVGINRGSANRFAIRRLIISSAIAGTVQIVTGTGPGTATPTVGQLKNKFIGQSDSPMNVFQGYAAAFPFTAGEMPGFAYMMNVQIAANTPFDLRFDTPLVLAFGYQLAIAPATVNRDIQVTFDAEQIV